MGNIRTSPCMDTCPLMRRLHRLCAAIGCLILASIHGSNALSRVAPASGAPLTGSGDVSRTVLTYKDLFSLRYAPSPVRDMSGFGLPPDAAQPTQSFEGTLTLGGFSNDTFRELSDVYKQIPPGNSPWKHLPAFSFRFVQDGSRIIPVRRGLIYTGNPDWNYILSPGRVWLEKSDHGYMRAALPFSLVQRNQNCVHNGELTFLFNRNKRPDISNVYYQITAETCYPMKFDEWGTLKATYTPGIVAHAAAIENAEAAQIADRMPTRPFSALRRAYPKAGLVLRDFTSRYTCSAQDPKCIRIYGLVIDGINYTSRCPTRYGFYAFCSEMRLPSYSTAKTLFANVALARLGEMYGPGVYRLLIKDFITPAAGNWSRTTLGDALDMATGNYNSDRFGADEASRDMNTFFTAERYSRKISDAFAFHERHARPGTRWVYHSSDIFLATSAMNLLLQRREGPGADLFNEVLKSVYIPLKVSPGFRSMLRTNNSPTGHPTGYYGLFYNRDDIAKLANWLNNGDGLIDGKQVLDPTLLRESLFRDPGVTGLRVPVPHDKDFFYLDGTWGKTMTPEQFPQYSCTFRIAFMSGYGGITVLLLPDGVTFYIFTDSGQFHWYGAVNEINKMAPFCPKR